MSVVKRGAALVLALLMVMMAMSMLTVQIAYAANPTATTANVTSTKTFKGGDKVSFTFEVTHNNNGLSSSSVKVGTTGSVKDSDFKASKGTVTVTDILTSGVGSNIVKYRVEVTDAEVAKGTGTSSSIKVQIKESTTSYDSGDISVTVPGYDDGSGGSSSEPDKPNTPSEASAKYTVTKVRGSKQEGSGNTSYPAPSDKVYFNINSVTSSSDASIRQTYFADITLRIFDDKAPEGITDANIVGAGVSSMDMGSFYFDKRVSTITVVDTVEGYYEVALTGLRYSGNSNKLTFRTRKDNYIGDVTAVITECITKQDASKEPSGDDDDDDSKLEVETPYVIVNKYSYGGGSVTAGDTFPLNLTIYNTSETEVVGNMMITVTMPEGLMLTSSSNTFYVEELDKHASITKSMQVTAKVDAKPQSHNVAVSMKYQYVDDRVNSRRSAETTENIAIPVIQVDRFQVTGVEIPMEAMLGEETGITVNFVNKGRSEAYNLSVEINGNIQNPGQNQNLGNLASGATGSADFYLMPNEVGMCTGEITLTYEDTNMQEKTATIRYNTTIKSPEEFMGGNGGMMVGPGGMGEEMPPTDEPKKSNLPIIIIGCVIVAIPVLVIVKKKVDAKRKEREDADL